MDTSKQIRKDLGLTQEGLATLLGVSRFSILRMEKGRDTLNTPTLLKLTTFQNTIKAEKFKTKKSSTKETTMYCRRLEEDCLFRLAILKRRLASMQKRFEKNCRLQSLLEQPNAGTDKRTRAWLNTQTIKIEKTSNQCNETEQAAQHVLISMCAAELTALRKYMRQHKIRPVKTNIS